MARPFLVRQQASLRHRESQLRARANNAMEEVKKALKVTADEIAAELVLSYPPELPDQKYRRTFTLMNSWEVGKVEESASGSISVEIKNTATDTSDGEERPYAVFVQDEEFQVEIHQERWPTIQEIQKEFAEIQRQRVRAAIRRGLGT
jgi:hypothetical protein